MTLPNRYAACASELSFHNLPAHVGIENGHRRSNLVRRLSEILLEHHTILIGHECHDAGIAKRHSQ